MRAELVFNIGGTIELSIGCMLPCTGMKLLNGSELAGFIKARQAQQVRTLRHSHNINPKLSIIVTIDHPVIDVYVRLKKQYGSEIQVDVDVYKVDQAEVPELLGRLNSDNTVHGIITQLPLKDPSKTDEIVNMVVASKDVDALGSDADFDPATPMAIMWLLAGYNVELRGKHILLIGRGKLVGVPLEKLLKNSGLEVVVADRSTPDLKTEALRADIIITAAGSPAILFSNMVKQGAVVVDAGVASEDGKTVGDVAPELYERDDLTLTPAKGGVGPLTVCALFDNVIRAARQNAGEV
ncbi:bifunctional 5,10-methylenetetrahydrofolate dehydrogenase/5,10-methenyltetrahydrofolate cyclohydrolase [Candidatus Saccharibacteria bacterium]|nr:bifunctional 5,10-methylenetetrahydrofolate dehydrogenase/5,10-methenyltetrahydrofolate cyclohydrolase [Candidatus Saccharibacteria bacterium]